MQTCGSAPVIGLGFDWHKWDVLQFLKMCVQVARLFQKQRSWITLYFSNEYHLCYSGKPSYHTGRKIWLHYASRRFDFMSGSERCKIEVFRSGRIEL